jgi:hypothetical protein
MHLYELSERFKNIQNTIENDGESFDEATLRQNLMEVTLLFDEKVESLAKIVKGLEAQQTAYKTEAERLTQKAKSAANKADWLKNYLSVELQNAKRDKVEGLVLNVILKTNPPSCKVIDEKQIPATFWRIIPEQKEVDKVGILSNFKQTGEVPNGVEIITDKKSVQIK